MDGAGEGEEGCQADGDKDGPAAMVRVPQGRRRLVSCLEEHFSYDNEDFNRALMGRGGTSPTTTRTLTGH